MTSLNGQETKGTEGHLKWQKRDGVARSRLRSRLGTLHLRSRLGTLFIWDPDWGHSLSEIQPGDILIWDPNCGHSHLRGYNHLWTWRMIDLKCWNDILDKLRYIWIFSLQIITEAGKMAQKLIALVALAEDLGEVPSTHMMAHNLWNSSSHDRALCSDLSRQ